MTEPVGLFGGRKKSITLFCSSTWQYCYRLITPRSCLLSYRGKESSHLRIVFILCNFHVYKSEKAYLKDLNAKQFLMIFLCIYLDEGRGGGGCTNAYYVLEHIVSLSYRTAQWMLTKLGRDEILMAPHLCLGFQQTPPRDGSRAGQKYVNEGSLLQRTPSSEWKATRPQQIECSAVSKSMKVVLLFVVPFWGEMFDGFVASYWTLSFLSYFYAPPPPELEFKALSFCLVCVCVSMAKL